MDEKLLSVMPLAFRWSKVALSGIKFYSFSYNDCCNENVAMHVHFRECYTKQRQCNVHGCTTKVGNKLQINSANVIQMSFLENLAIPQEIEISLKWISLSYNVFQYSDIARTIHKGKTKNTELLNRGRFRAQGNISFPNYHNRL